MSAVSAMDFEADDDAPRPRRRRPPPKGAGRSKGRGAPRGGRRRGREDSPAPPLGVLAGWAADFRARMRRSAAFTGAVGGLFLLAALSGAVTGGHVPGAVTTVRDGLYAFLGAGGLTVQSVKIVGQALAPAKVLEDAIGVVPRQTSIFDAEPHAIRARLEALPWVARADVRRVWPNRIEVLIVERRPFAIWQREGQLHVIDRDGAPIAQHDPQLFANLLLVVGPGAGARAVQLVDLLDRQPGFKARVRAAVLVGQRRWNLRLDNGVEVRLPEEGAEAAISDLVQLDREQQLLARQIEAIDMRFPDRLIVKLPQGSPDAPRKPAAEGRDT